jgi:hypothetical protein
MEAISEGEVRSVMMKLFEHYVAFASNGMTSVEFTDKYKEILEPLLTASDSAELGGLDTLLDDPSNNELYSSEFETLKVMENYGLAGRLRILHIESGKDLKEIPYVTETRESMMKTMSAWDKKTLVRYLIDRHDNSYPSDFDYAVLKTLSPLLEREKTPYDRKV